MSSLIATFIAARNMTDSFKPGQITQGSLTSV